MGIFTARSAFLGIIEVVFATWNAIQTLMKIQEGCRDVRAGESVHRFDHQVSLRDPP